MFGTLAFFFINAVSNSRLNDDYYEGVSSTFKVLVMNYLTIQGCMGSCGAKVWLFFGFLCSFGSVIGELGAFSAHLYSNSLFSASMWILFGAYVSNDELTPTPDDLKYCPSKVYPGVAIFLQVI